MSGHRTRPFDHPSPGGIYEKARLRSKLLGRAFDDPAFRADLQALMSSRAADDAGARAALERRYGLDRVIPRALCFWYPQDNYGGQEALLYDATDDQHFPMLETRPLTVTITVDWDVWWSDVERKIAAVRKRHQEMEREMEAKGFLWPDTAPDEEHHLDWAYRRGKGESAEAIARDAGVGPGTVDRAVRRIRKRGGFRSRADA